MVIAGIAGIFAYNNFLKPEPALVTATISIDYGNGTVLSEEIGSDNNTALGLLYSFVGEDNVDATDMGFVNSINGIGNSVDVPGLNDTDQRWWMLYVDDEMAMESAGTLEIFNGTHVEYRFMIPEW